MAAQRQRVRMTFLIGLTLAVVAFGGVKLTRAYRRKQERTEYARAERDIRQYAADLLQAEHEQLQDIAVIAQGPIGRDAAALLMQTRYLTASGAGRRPGESSQVAPRAFADIKENFNRIQKGLPRLFPTGRPFLRGYYSELDDTFQPYGVCLPRTYNGTRRYPLIITLDDYPSGEPFQCMDAPYYEGAISVKPQGRGATDYMHIGEDDVVKVLEEASAIYNIDRQRVYLTGASIGAMGCWNLAAHYPHLFAGIVPVDWSSQHRPPKQQRAELTGRAGAHQELKEFLSSALSPVSYAENLQYCHIAVVNYATDDVALMEQPRTMVERLRELAYPVDYLELPHAPAGASAGWARDYALAKVFGKASSGKPTQFRHKTASLRHGRAWWIRMGRLDDPVRFATVEAKLADARAEITTDNVSAVTVLLEEAPTTIRQVCVDGAEFPVLADLDAHGLQLVKWSGVWQRRTVVPLMKQMGLSGPFSDVLRDPFVVVYGTTSESEVQNEISYQEAARFAKDWQRLYGEEPRLKADTEINRRHLAELNLLLFGGPSVNAVTREMATELPVKLQGDAVRLGEDTYRGEDVGIMMCYPNPLSPNRMVALVAGTTPGALYQAYDRTGLWFNLRAYSKYKWFDYAVFGNRTLGPESFLAVGFFDNKWDFAPNGDSPVGGGAEWRADPEVVAGIQPQAFPALESAADSTDKEVCLSDVRPVAIDQHMGAVGFDRSYTGGPVQIGDNTFSKGLGVRAPSRISFAVGGRFRRFRAIVGVAPEARHELTPALLGAERVAFQVWGDGRLIETSAPLSWHEAGLSRQHIEADVRGIRVLTLAVQPVGGEIPPHCTAAWAAPTVIRYD